MIQPSFSSFGYTMKSLTSQATGRNDIVTVDTRDMAAIAESDMIDNGVIIQGLYRYHDAAGKVYAGIRAKNCKEIRWYYKDPSATDWVFGRTATDFVSSAGASHRMVIFRMTSLNGQYVHSPVLVWGETKANPAQAVEDFHNAISNAPLSAAPLFDAAVVVPDFVGEVKVEKVNGIPVKEE